MRIIQNFNQDWLFIPEQVAMDYPDNEFEEITLPHSNKTFSQRFVNNEDYQFVSTYRKHFAIDQNLDGKRVFIQFEGAMLETSLYLNGELLGVHQGGFTPFTFELTESLSPNENILTAYVDSREQTHIPPYGNLVDFLTFGGIYRDVSLIIVDNCYMTEIIATPTQVMTNPQLDCSIQLSDYVPDFAIHLTLLDDKNQTISQIEQSVTSREIPLTLANLDIERWSLNNPKLYTLKLSLHHQNSVIDTYETRIGFRKAEFSADGHFYLNDEVVKLFGLNRHQTYPFIGAAAPKRLQELDADILKHELGCNIVRTSHYAQSPHFLNRCDEIGLLVFEEIAGWQHIGDEAWQALVLADLKAMIERDRHHPSIILWGVRVNESPDCETLYSQTNALAHKLDPSRQTGGVRNFAESQQLEDVFTLNDFTDIIQTPRPPHLITEFAGHMFPTKTNDHEARRVEHALKHARKHNLQFGHEDVAGAIAWCAFDYHTHKEFGSGDRICHHGVMDMFRLPKYAGYFYRSQKSPEDEVVLFPASSWTMGDRDGGGNNPLIIFSNCESIEVLIGEESQGYYEPDYVNYPHLPHPPFTVKWAEPYNPWGTEFKDLKVRGYIDGQIVKEHCVASDHLPHKLVLSSHTTTLCADGSDMARIVVQILDKFGNVLPYQSSAVLWSLDGNAQLLGENPMVLLGGQGACFVKAGHQAGKIKISASVPMLKANTLELDIIS